MENTLTLREYQQAVKRTLPDLGSEALNICHMILGLNSEYNELYEATTDLNRGEELTDYAWYLTNYCNLKNIDIWRIFEFSDGYCCELPDKDNYIEMLQVEVSKLTDLEKKSIAYKKVIESEDLLIHIVTVYERLNDCYVYYNISPAESMYKNIEKLKVRYPEKFSEHHAINRDLEKEKQVL